jgi:hypothetical protein
MQDPFEAPASGEFIDWDDMEGELLLFTVTDYKEQSTRYDKDDKPSKAVEADIVVLTGENAGTVYEEALIFPKVLAARLKPRIGSMVLARIICIKSKELQAQWGKNAKKWDFADPPYSEADAELARKWIKENEKPKEDPFAEDE